MIIQLCDICCKSIPSLYADASLYTAKNCLYLNRSYECSTLTMLRTTFSGQLDMLFLLLSSDSDKHSLSCVDLICSDIVFITMVNSKDLSRNTDVGPTLTLISNFSMLPMSLLWFNCLKHTLCYWQDNVKGYKSKNHY